MDEDEIPEGGTDSPETASQYTKSRSDTEDIDKDFRLWVTARSDEGRLIPGKMRFI